MNFPNVDLVQKTNVTRIMNVHRNEPGVLGEINGYISEAGANIQAQYLSTDSKIGYLVVDLEMDKAKLSSAQLIDKIQKSTRNIKTHQVF